MDHADVNWLFLDMNSYFASVEQQVQPALRGKPVAVVTVDTDSTCCIAASYEAKRFGVTTGVSLGDAKRLCPELHVIEARHELYIEHHQKILQAVDQVIPISRVISIDEMECRLMGRERQLQNALHLGSEVKKAIYRTVGEYQRCSVGLAPNRFLAKTASDLQKPDGLVSIQRNQLPGVLYPLELSDLSGIGSRMERRLHQSGVRTIEQLCTLGVDQMTRIWGGVVGTRFWYKLRGDDFDEDVSTHKSSLGHQHVLPPELRTREMAGAVGKKLLHKAAFRLRQLQLWSKGMVVWASYSKKRTTESGYWMHHERPVWEASLRFPACQDTMTLVKIFDEVWQESPELRPVMVSVTLVDLTPDHLQNRGLFDDLYRAWRFERVAETVDKINIKYGSKTLYLASIQAVRDTAPPRIAFTSIPDINLK